jgi:predicted permease
MWQDIAVASRFLLKRPIATAIGILTLGVTVATSTITLGVLDQALWQPARAERGGDLVTVYSRRLAPPFYQTLSYPDYLQVRDRLNDALELAALVRVENTLGGGEWPTRIAGELVSGNYFAVMNAKPFLGRLLTPDDDRAGSEPVVVLGHDVWRRTFGGDPGIIGSSLRLGRGTVTVVGVAPPGFRSPAWPSNNWLPRSMARTLFGADLLLRADAPIFQPVGRANASRIQPQIRSRVAAIAPYSSGDGWRLDVFPGSYLRFWPAYRSTVGQFLGVFAGLAICVLVIACANLAGLLLARASERQRELAVRQALGASGFQLARRLVAEGIVLTAGGACVAALLVLWSAPFVARLPLPVPAKVGLTFDARLVVVMLAVSLAASVLFTALSAWKGLRSDPRGVLSASSITVAPRSRAHAVLVVAQVALGCVLLTVGGLLVMSAWKVAHIDVGFDSANAVLGRVMLFDQGY